MGPNPICWCPYKKKLGYRHTRGMTMSGHREKMPSARQREKLRRKPPCHPLISDFWPPELWSNTFPLFKPLSLWDFVMTAWAGSYSAFWKVDSSGTELKCLLDDFLSLGEGEHSLIGKHWNERRVFYWLSFEQDSFLHHTKYLDSRSLTHPIEEKT
jgi:hypothetical protein